MYRSRQGLSVELVDAAASPPASPRHDAWASRSTPQALARRASTDSSVAARDEAADQLLPFAQNVEGVGSRLPSAIAWNASELERARDMPAMNTELERLNVKSLGSEHGVDLIEFPADDLPRAKRFWEGLLDLSLDAPAPAARARAADP